MTVQYVVVDDENFWRVEECWLVTVDQEVAEMMEDLGRFDDSMPTVSDVYLSKELK